MTERTIEDLACKAFAQERAAVVAAITSVIQAYNAPGPGTARAADLVNAVD